MFCFDALYAIEDGFYIVTDRKIGVYSKDYSSPIKLPFEQIIVDLEGNSCLIPLSSGKGSNKRFVEALKRELDKRGITGAPDSDDDEPGPDGGLYH